MSEETTQSSNPVSLELFDGLTIIDNFANTIPENWKNDPQDISRAIGDASSVTDFEMPPMVFSKLKTIGDYGMYHTFKGMSAFDRVPQFPVLDSIGRSGMYQTFMNCRFFAKYLAENEQTRTVTFPVLKTIADRGMNLTFAGCTPNLSEEKYGLVDFSMPSLTSVGEYGMHQTFMNCKNLMGRYMEVTLHDGTTLKTSYGVAFEKLETVYGYGLSGCFDGCTGFRHCFFPNLKYDPVSKPFVDINTRFENIGNVINPETEGGLSNNELPYRIVTITTQYRYMKNGESLPNSEELKAKKVPTLCQSSFKNAFRGCSNIIVHFPKALATTKINQSDLEVSYVSEMSNKKIDTTNMTFKDIWTPSYLGMYNNAPTLTAKASVEVRFDLDPDNFEIKEIR